MASTSRVETERPLRMRVSPDARCPHVVFERVFGPERGRGPARLCRGAARGFPAGQDPQARIGRGDGGHAAAKSLADQRPRRIRRHARRLRAIHRGQDAGRAAPRRAGRRAARVRSHRLSRRRLFSRAHRHDRAHRHGPRRVLRLLFRGHAARFRRRLTAALRSTTPLDRRPEATPYVDVPPESDTLVAFPSWLRHEVLPVHVPSGAWRDSRFAINCWLHRARQAAGTPP